MIFKEWLLLGMALCLTASPAGAQNNPKPDIDQETRAPGRAQQRQSTAQAAEEASKLETAEADMGISYDQILAKPDDIELNYRYARAQIARGELKSAAATLERILLIRPELAKVRLLYAVVLLRLDNLVEAQQELETLKALPMPDSLRQEIEKYLALIKSSRKSTHLSGSLGLGWENDDNRNATPSSDRMQFGGVPVTLIGTSGMRHDDASMLFMGNAGVVHDLGFQEGHNVFANYSYYRAEQASVKSLNLQAHSVSGGFTYKSPWLNVTPKGYFDHILLAQTTFLRQWGVGARLDRAINRNLTLYMEFKDVEQQYQVTANVPTGPQRDGADLTFVWGGDYVLSAKQKIGVSYGYEQKDANIESLSYNRNTINLRHEWLLPKGTFLLSGASFNHDEYDQPDPNVARTFRRDNWMRFSFTAGAPMSLIHPVLKDLLFTLSYEFFDSLSSIENFAYTNNKIVGLLTYRWDAAF
ncbi:MAG: DUF560 domain-containing protein [Elusimicrobia bacterium]|nr:DUF560 domain-containing protein [Elusimicrobiota bacterium]